MFWCSGLQVLAPPHHSSALPEAKEIDFTKVFGKKNLLGFQKMVQNCWLIAQVVQVLVFNLYSTWLIMICIPCIYWWCKGGEPSNFFICLLGSTCYLHMWSFSKSGMKDWTLLFEKFEYSHWPLTFCRLWNYPILSCLYLPRLLWTCGCLSFQFFYLLNYICLVSLSTFPQHFKLFGELPSHKKNEHAIGVNRKISLRST